jgi:hypothetical protein
MAEPFEGTPVGPVEPCPQDRAHWIEIQLLDEEEMPVANEEYVVTLTDGSTVRGYLDAEGCARFAVNDPGNCKVMFPRIDSTAWKDA